MRLPLGIPMLPVSAVMQALDDLHAIAEAARRLPAIEANLTRQFEVLNGQADSIIALGDRIVGLGERIESLGGRLVERSGELLARSDEVMEESERVRASAHEVSVRGAEVAAALPTLQQIATTTEPLQGAIERFGRMVDRLPGGDRERRP